MRDILAPANRELLAQYAWSNVLLAFDFDGTLSPIVPDPMRAELPGATRRLLAEATRIYPCVVVSGRSQRDVVRRLRGVGVREVIGNHGIEPWQGSQAYARVVRRWRVQLARLLAAQPGLQIEDKHYSLAIHYRRSRAKKRALAAILAAVASLGGARVIRGKLVVNVLPRGAPHKGIALEAALSRLRCDTAIYVGDDETDEDVFALEEPGRILGVRVGAKRATLASYCVRRQSEVGRLLRRLIDLRRRSGQPEDRNPR